MKSHAEYFASKFLKRLKIIKVNLLMLKSIFNKSESTASFIHIFIFEDNEILIRIVNLVYVRINFDVYLKINLTFKPFSLLQFYWFWDLFQKQLEYGKKHHYTIKYEICFWNLIFFKRNLMKFRIFRYFN